MLRTLFFGTSAFAVPSLRIFASRTELLGVVTQPDRPSGRGQRLHPTPVKAAALELGLTVYEPVKLRAFCEEMMGESFDLFGLASYGRILPQALLDLPRLGALNVHPSLLPKYRGATPIQSALRNGEQVTGVSIMLMDAGMDTGEIALQERVPISRDDDYGSLHDRLAGVGAKMLGKAIAAAADGTLLHAPQSGEASLTRPIAPADLVVDWNADARAIVDQVRAFAPRPAARGELHGETVKLLRAHVGANDEVIVDELIAPNRGKMTGEAYARSAAARSDR
ncbi:MAG: methionyl-tRNA formyltransferase [Candidatus Eremiobacteraeota bacterium]|nr:methionyl-tRNA formyltransferase [Candidatus Eremiobacteraeota bacterium]